MIVKPLGYVRSKKGGMHRATPTGRESAWIKIPCTMAALKPINSSYNVHKEALNFMKTFNERVLNVKDSAIEWYPVRKRLFTIS